MKPTLKTIFLCFLALLDCIFGTIVVLASIEYNKKESVAPVKASINYTYINKLSDISSIVYVEEQEEEKKEKTEEKIVYDGMTLKQLSNKLNKSLKSNLKNKGNLIASYSLKKGVDPYVATAIMLHETGCEYGCSTLVKKCNNVGGMKGSGCGSYSAFSSLDKGIKKFIDNLSKNYYAKGLDTPAKMNKKYAADKSWSKKVNAYVKKIKNK